VDNYYSLGYSLDNYLDMLNKLVVVVVVDIVVLVVVVVE